MHETKVQSLGQEDPLEKGMVPTPVFLLGEFHVQRSLVGYSPWSRKETRLTNTFTFPLISNKNSSFIRMLSVIPTEIHGLFIELNPRLNERP